MQAVFVKVLSLLLVQSLDPLPMHGRDLGVHPDDFVEAPEVEQEAKQEILENKDVSITGSCSTASQNPQIVPFTIVENIILFWLFCGRDCWL